MHNDPSPAFEARVLERLEEAATDGRLLNSSEIIAYRNTAESGILTTDAQTKADQWLAEAVERVINESEKLGGDHVKAINGYLASAKRLNPSASPTEDRIREIASKHQGLRLTKPDTESRDLAAG